MSYTDIVESMQTLPYNDKLELKNLLEKYIIEEHRDEIYNNHLKALEMAKKGELKFSSDIDTLMKMLD